MFYLLLSIIPGVIIVVSRILNTKLSETTGVMGSTFFNYFTASIAAIILFVFSGEKFHFLNLSSVPAYGYLGGILGVVIVMLNSVVTPKMSSFYVTLLIFIGQLFTGILIDYLTSGELSLSKIAGGALVAVGLVYNLYVDYTADSDSVCCD